MIIFGKQKKRITFRLGCLWFYIKRLDDINQFDIATENMAALCVDLGVSWDAMQKAEQTYRQAVAYDG